MLVYFLNWHGNYCFESTCIKCYKSFYLITHLTSFSNTTLWCDQECVSLLLILWSLINFLLLYFFLPNSATTPHFLIKEWTTVKVEYYFALASNKRHVRLTISWVTVEPGSQALFLNKFLLGLTISYKNLQFLRFF